jgi:hypothetical protein
MEGSDSPSISHSVSKFTSKVALQFRQLHDLNCSPNIIREVKSKGKPRTRWKDVVQRDTLEVPGIRGWRKQAGVREEWGRLLRDGWMIKAKRKTLARRVARMRGKQKYVQ